METDRIKSILAASDEQVGPACMFVDVPPTIVMDAGFREPYMQGYRHALSDVRAALKSSLPSTASQAPSAPAVIREIVQEMRAFAGPTSEWDQRDDTPKAILQWADRLASLCPPGDR